MDVHKPSGNYQSKWFGLAIQALIILSRENIQTCPSVEIAAMLQAEVTQLRRVLAVLAREGFIGTREGRDGGYRLIQNPETITLEAVYDAYQVNSRLSFEILGTTGTHAFGSQMKQAFGDITQEMDQSTREVLRRYTIADLAKRVDSASDQPRER